MMAVDEHARYELHGRLDEALGPSAAATLMEHLPPTGWGSVVTREHLELRFDEIDARFDTLESKIDGLRHELTASFRGEINQAVVAQNRLMVFSLLGTLATLGGFALALARFAT